MSILKDSFHRKSCCKANSQSLPDASLGFSGCLVVLFSRLIVVVKVLEGKKQRERKMKINSGVFYSSAEFSL